MMIKKELPLIVNRDISLVDPSTEEAGEVEWRFDEAGNTEKLDLPEKQWSPHATNKE